MIDEQVRSKVLGTVDSLRDELVKLVSDTVRIPSVAPLPPSIDPDFEPEWLGGETRVNQFLQPVMQSFGLETDLWEEEPGRANLVGTWRGRGRGRSLILNGHVDVVSPGSGSLWTVAGPWSGKVIDGRIYGRGSTDMKAGNAAGIYALKAVLQAGFQPRGDIHIEAVVGDEHMDTDFGVGATVKRGYRADAAIVMESSAPPYRFSINTASPGLFLMQVIVRGKATHISMRDELVRAGGRGAKVGASAIDKAFLVQQGLLRLEEEWGQTKAHPAFTRPGHFVLYPKYIEGGDLMGASIPDRCVMVYVVWHAPQDAPEDAEREIREHVARIAQTDPWLRENPPEVNRIPFYWPPFDLPPDSPICQAAAVACEAALNQPPRFYGAAYTSDATFLNQLGIPTIVLGPGSIEVAHGYNEYVEIQDIVDAAKIYALTIVEWCGV